MSPKKITLIGGSLRGVRVGPDVVTFINKVLATSTTTPAPVVEILDIGSFDLPIFNEKTAPMMVPQMAQFEYAHSKAWSAAIAAFDGYVCPHP